MRLRSGIYVADTVSHGLPVKERQKQRMERLAVIMQSSAVNHIAGFWPRMTHKELDNDLGNYEQVLDYAAEYGKGVSLNIIDRNFGSTAEKYEPRIPDRAKALGLYKRTNTGHGKLWAPEYVDIQLELMQQLSRFDNHDGQVQICWGETSINPDGSDQAYTNQLIRLMVEGKKLLPETQVGTKCNFLGDGLRFLEQIFEACVDNKGCFITNPDTVLQRWEQYKGDKLDYTIRMYDLYEKYKGKVIISPKMETWDMKKGDTLATMKWAVHTLGANHICVQNSFDSRRDSAMPWPRYFESIVEPSIKSLTDRDFEAMAKRPANFNGSIKPPPVVEPPIVILPEEPPMTTPDPEIRPAIMQVPEKGAPIKNEFGFFYARTLLDRVANNEQYPPDIYRVIRRHKYSTFYPWSHDNKYFLTYEGGKGVSFLLDGNTGYYKKLFKHGLYECVWIAVHGRATLLGIDGDDLVIIDAETEKRIIIGTGFKGYTLGNSEGHISQKGFALYTKNAANNAGNLSCIFLHIVNGAIGYTETFELGGIGSGFNTATVSDSGRHIVAMSKNAGTVVYSNTQLGFGINPQPTTLHGREHHGLVTTDIEGRDILVQTGIVVENNERRIVAWDLDTLKPRDIYGGTGLYTNDHKTNGKSLSGHIGHAPKGYVFLSCSTDKQGIHVCGYLATDGSKRFIQVGHTYEPKGGYYFEAHGVARRDGAMAVIVGDVNATAISIFINTDSIKDGLVTVPPIVEPPPEPPIVEPEPEDLVDALAILTEAINRNSNTLEYLANSILIINNKN
ncbi:MAG: hypothetical protein GY941_19865 [Planctomycetes bacterium]|nr:hypothetical protein [Planctomycetota bacterium]